MPKIYWTVALHVDKDAVVDIRPKHLSIGYGKGLATEEPLGYKKTFCFI